MNNKLLEPYLKTNYIIVAGKNEKDLKKLLEDLREYIVGRKNKSEIDIKHNFNRFRTYISLKKGYTKILNNYWQQDKIYVMCVASKSNIVCNRSKEMIEKDIQKNGFTKWGFIVDTNYNERKQLYNANLKGEMKNAY